MPEESRWYNHHRDQTPEESQALTAAKYVIKLDSMDATSSRRKEERERKAERRQHSQQSKPARKTTQCSHIYPLSKIAILDNETCLESRCL